MAYGLYPNMYGSQASIDQLTQQLQNTLSQIQGMQQQQQAPQKQRRSGEYIVVDSFKEVEETPVRMDGTPTLFICPSEHVFWEKRHTRNGAVCETYPYSSSLASAPRQEPEVDYTKVMDEPKPEPDIDSRIEAAVERVLTKILDKKKEDTPE